MRGSRAPGRRRPGCLFFPYTRPTPIKVPRRKETHHRDQLHHTSFMGGRAVHVLASGSYFSPELSVCLFSSWPPNTNKNPSEKSTRTNRTPSARAMAHSELPPQPRQSSCFSVTDPNLSVTLAILLQSTVFEVILTLHEEKKGDAPLSSQAAQGHLSPLHYSLAL